MLSLRVGARVFAAAITEIGGLLTRANRDERRSDDAGEDLHRHWEAVQSYWTFHDFRTGVMVPFVSGFIVIVTRRSVSDRIGGLALLKGPVPVVVPHLCPTSTIP